MTMTLEIDKNRVFFLFAIIAIFSQSCHIVEFEPISFNMQNLANGSDFFTTAKTASSSIPIAEILGCIMIATFLYGLLRIMICVFEMTCYFFTVAAMLIKTCYNCGANLSKLLFQNLSLISVSKVLQTIISLFSRQKRSRSTSFSKGEYQARLSARKRILNYKSYQALTSKIEKVDPDWAKSIFELISNSDSQNKIPYSKNLETPLLGGGLIEEIDNTGLPKEKTPLKAPPKLGVCGSNNEGDESSEDDDLMGLGGSSQDDEVENVFTNGYGKKTPQTAFKNKNDKKQESLRKRVLRSRNATNSGHYSKLSENDELLFNAPTEQCKKGNGPGRPKGTSQSKPPQFKSRFARKLSASSNKMGLSDVDAFSQTDSENEGSQKPLTREQLKADKNLCSEEVKNLMVNTAAMLGKIKNKAFTTEFMKLMKSLNQFHDLDEKTSSPPTKTQAKPGVIEDEDRLNKENLDEKVNKSVKKNLEKLLESVSPKAQPSKSGKESSKTNKSKKTDVELTEDEMISQAMKLSLQGLEDCVKSKKAEKTGKSGKSEKSKKVSPRKTPYPGKDKEDEDLGLLKNLPNSDSDDDEYDSDNSENDGSVQAWPGISISSKPDTNVNMVNAGIPNFTIPLMMNNSERFNPKYIRANEIKRYLRSFTEQCQLSNMSSTSMVQYLLTMSDGYYRTFVQDTKDSNQDISWKQMVKQILEFFVIRRSQQEKMTYAQTFIQQPNQNFRAYLIELKRRLKDANPNMSEREIVRTAINNSDDENRKALVIARPKTLKDLTKICNDLEKAENNRSYNVTNYSRNSNRRQQLVNSVNDIGIDHINTLAQSGAEKAPINTYQQLVNDTISKTMDTLNKKGVFPNSQTPTQNGQSNSGNNPSSQSNPPRLENGPSFNGQANGQFRRQNSEIKCYYCNLSGHTRPQCHSRQNDEARGQFWQTHFKTEGNSQSNNTSRASSPNGNNMQRNSVNNFSSFNRSPSPPPQRRYDGFSSRPNNDRFNGQQSRSYSDVVQGNFQQRPSSPNQTFDRNSRPQNGYQGFRQNQSGYQQNGYQQNGYQSRPQSGYQQRPQNGYQSQNGYQQRQGFQGNFQRQGFAGNNNFQQNRERTPFQPRTNGQSGGFQRQNNFVRNNGQFQNSQSYLNNAQAGPRQNRIVDNPNLMPLGQRRNSQPALNSNRP